MVVIKVFRITMWPSVRGSHNLIGRAFGAQGGTPDFRWGGVIKGFLGFEIFNSGIFWVGEFGKYFLCVCGSIWEGIFLGIQNNLKILGSAD